MLRVVKRYVKVFNLEKKSDSHFTGSLLHWKILLMARLPSSFFVVYRIFDLTAWFDVLNLAATSSSSVKLWLKNCRLELTKGIKACPQTERQSDCQWMLVTQNIFRFVENLPKIEVKLLAAINCLCRRSVPKFNLNNSFFQVPLNGIWYPLTNAKFFSISSIVMIFNLLNCSFVGLLCSVVGVTSSFPFFHTFFCCDSCASKATSLRQHFVVLKVFRVYKRNGYRLRIG